MTDRCRVMWSSVYFPPVTSWARNGTHGDQICITARHSRQGAPRHKVRGQLGGRVPPRLGHRELHSEFPGMEPEDCQRDLLSLSSPERQPLYQGSFHVQAYRRLVRPGRQLRRQCSFGAALGLAPGHEVRDYLEEITSRIWPSLSQEQSTPPASSPAWTRGQPRRATLTSLVTCTSTPLSGKSS